MQRIRGKPRDIYDLLKIMQWPLAKPTKELKFPGFQTADPFIERQCFPVDVESILDQSYTLRKSL